MWGCCRFLSNRPDWKILSHLLNWIFGFMVLHPSPSSASLLIRQAILWQLAMSDLVVEILQFCFWCVTHFYVNECVHTVFIVARIISVYVHWIIWCHQQSLHHYIPVVTLWHCWLMHCQFWATLFHSSYMDLLCWTVEWTVKPKFHVEEVQY